MADLRKLGSTSNIVRLLLTKSTDGTAFTGASNSSSGLIVSTITDNEATATAYTVAGSNVETIVTLGTWSAPTTGKCRFREVDATNHPGLYELHFSDSRFSVSNAKRLLITISGVTGLFPAHYEIQLTQADVYDAVRLGLTALPNNTNLANAYSAFESGTAQAGGASTITLRSGASATNDYYKDQVVFVVTGTGAGQTNRITGYVGSTKVATVGTAWATQPDATSTYLVLGRVG